MQFPVVFIFLLVISITRISASPIVPESNREFPDAYNLHQNFTPTDINSLSSEQKQKALVDVQTTIEEVQKLLLADPNLPRLTKGEIEDLFENVTKEELEKSIRNGNHERAEQMRILMTVLPHHSKETVKTVTSSTNKINKPIVRKATTISATTISTTTSTTTTTVAPETSPNFDYGAFKALNIDEKNMEPELKEFLKQFGLVDGPTSRNSKPKHTYKDSIPAAQSSAPLALTSSLDSDMFSEDQMKLLGNLGITMKDSKKESKNKSKYATNIFKPAPVQKFNSDEDDYKKLEHLLETIKDLEKLNANLTEEELDLLDLKRFNLSEGLLAKGPSPLDFSRNNSPYQLKNEVKKKRQNSDTSTSSLEIISTTKNGSNNNIIEVLNQEKEPDSESSTTTEASTTTEGRNLLEDELEPTTGDEEPLPLPRRSGFYFLADWNSFLEVGQDEEKVVVRFDPKVGDPSRFIPVNVP